MQMVYPLVADLIKSKVSQVEFKKMEKELAECKKKWSSEVKAREKVEKERQGFLKVSEELSREKREFEDAARERGQELEEEVSRLKEQHNKTLDDAKNEMGDEVAKAKDTAFDEGVEEGVLRFMYTMWLHFPNPFCPNFSFSPNGEAGLSEVATFDSDKADKEARTDTQKQNKDSVQGFILPCII